MQKNKMVENQQEILKSIKALIQEEIPDAKVYLFGSRVTGKVHDESDWDILVLTEKKYSYEMRKLIDEKLFFLGISTGSTISMILATKKDWETHPGYYSLQLGIGDNYVSL